MLKPPCNCKPSNVNTFGFAKGPDTSGAIASGLDGQRLRPSLNYSLVSNIPNVFNQEIPKFVLNWTSSKDRANPRVQRTPRKSQDKKVKVRL